MPEEHEGLVRNQESGPNIVAVELGSIPGDDTKTDPRFVRLCGEQSDILLNKCISKRFKVQWCSARTMANAGSVCRG